MSELILSDLNEGILTLTFNRPERKNALTLAMYTALTEHLKHAKESSDVRVVIFTGSGDSFTSGNDLKDFMQNPPQDLDTPVFHFLRALVEFPKPIIASVNGLAIGIGTTLLLHCDFVYAHKDVIFQMPFIRLGLVPEAGSSYLLPRMAGHRKASELLMLGEKFNADFAQEVGIINRVCPADTLQDQAYETAKKLTQLPPQALRQTKALLKGGNAETLGMEMMKEGELFMKRLTSPETMEAIQAFFAKRAPDFSRFS